MRLTVSTLMLVISLLLGRAAWADDVAEFEAVPELPAAQIFCVGEAALPDMLRFAFQEEPEMTGPPEIIRVASPRRPAARAVAPRPAGRLVARRAEPAGPPMLRLPCIRG